VVYNPIKLNWVSLLPSYYYLNYRPGLITWVNDLVTKVVNYLLFLIYIERLYLTSLVSRYRALKRGVRMLAYYSLSGVVI